MQTNEKTKSSAVLASRIPGWGADLLPENRPGVPKEKAPPNGTGAHWTQPERQKPESKILKTIERPDLTPVFGDTCPPKGLSGIIRGFAYQQPEDRVVRWVSLLLADRIDVIETIAMDIVRGRAGNPFTQTGIQVELHEGGRFGPARRKTVGMIALGVASIGLGAWGLLRSSAKKPARARKRAHSSRKAA